MTDSLGAWPNAPLAYVLAEVRTELIADIKEFQPKIAGRLREEYPIQKMVHPARLVASGTRMVLEHEQQDTAWEFAAPDNRTAVILRSNGVVFHATSYRDSREFLTRLDKVVTLFSQEVKSIFVSRLGLRYVDFIIPRDDELPEAYVNSHLDLDLGLSQQGGPTATCVSIYPMQAGQLTLRYVRAMGGPKLPPDLATTSLDPAPLVKNAKSDRFAASLDTDRTIVFAPVERLDLAKVRDHFALMRTDIRTAFEKAASDHARRIWKTK